MIELRGEFDFRVQWDFCLAEDIELKEQQIDYLSCPPQHLVAEGGCQQEV